MRNAYQEFDHDVEPFITDFVREVLETERPFDMRQEEATYKVCFKLVGSAMGEDAWRHYRKGQHRGGFSVYVFEGVSIGIVVNIEGIKSLKKTQLVKRIIAFKEDKRFTYNTGAGANTKVKLHNRIKFAISHFA